MWVVGASSFLIVFNFQPLIVGMHSQRKFATSAIHSVTELAVAMCSYGHFFHVSFTLCHGVNNKLADFAKKSRA